MTTRIKNKNHIFLKRPCYRCHKPFRPNSKFNFVCPECCDKIEWGSWHHKKSIKSGEAIKE